MIERIDDFTGTDLDRDTWLPHYLPCWSSLDRTRASYAVSDSILSLIVPTDAPRWCRDDHPEPLRVSGIQSGNFSGPVGSTLGQQRFRDGLRVAEQQERFEGWLVGPGRIEVRCAMDLSPRSMAALWLSGFEDPVADAGEICVVEIFGRSIDAGSVEVGCGIKQVFDPRLVHDFDAPRIELDITAFHTYAAEWDDVSATFSVDGTVLRTSAFPPAYPMQIMIGVFDFPNWTDGNDDDHVPSIDLDLVRGVRLGERLTAVRGFAGGCTDRATVVVDGPVRLRHLVGGAARRAGRIIRSDSVPTRLTMRSTSR